MQLLAYPHPATSSQRLSGRRVLQTRDLITPSTGTSDDSQRHKEWSWTSTDVVTRRELLQNAAGIDSSTISSGSDSDAFASVQESEPVIGRRTVTLLLLMAFVCGVFVMGLALWCFAVCCHGGEDGPGKFYSSSRDALFPLRKGAEFGPDDGPDDLESQVRLCSTSHSTADSITLCCIELCSTKPRTTELYQLLQPRL